MAERNLEREKEISERAHATGHRFGFITGFIFGRTLLPAVIFVLLWWLLDLSVKRPGFWVALAVAVGVVLARVLPHWGHWGHPPADS